MKTLLVLQIAVAGTLIVGAATADDAKMYLGAHCSFADNPLASHNRIHHAFKNTSGTSQWITCPAVRDHIWEDIDHAGVYIEGSASNVRLEQRTHVTGTVVGWNGNWFASGSQMTGYNWPTLNTGTSNASYSIEMYLSNNSSVSGYSIEEIN